nr:hypothetical protein [Hyphomicrobium methylovorum]
MEKATEAFFELSQASVAANLAWQSSLHNQFNSAFGTGPVASAWDIPQPRRPEPVHVAIPMDPAGAWQAAADGCAAWKSWFEAWAGQPAKPALPSFTPNWVTPQPAAQAFCANDPTGLTAAMMEWQSSVAMAIWNNTPRSFYQAPMMAFMLSYGVPYAVAAPTARASTSAMDAADAACAQWRLMLTGKNDPSSTIRQLMSPMGWSVSVH